MSMSAGMLPEFDLEMKNTRVTLERITDELLDWKPHTKSFSFQELGNHLARLPEWGAVTIQRTSLDVDPEMGEFTPPPPGETVEEILAVFDKSVAAFRAAFETVSDGDLMVPWTLKNGGKEIFTMPRIAVIRGMILNHIIHHRGQLTMYLRLNDLPLPALYGPSADEEM